MLCINKSFINQNKKVLSVTDEEKNEYLLHLKSNTLYDLKQKKIC